MQFKILNTVGPIFTEEAKTILSQLGSVDYFEGTQLELATRIASSGIVVCGLGFRFDREVLEHAKNLRLIATATTGLDHIDVDYAKERGIGVISLHGEDEFLNTITGTAELAVGLMINLMRGISAGFESVKRYEWDRERFRGHVLHGKTLGIVGLGRLGKMMARYGESFGMQVLACDRGQSIGKGLSSRIVSFDELVEQGDIISIHVPLSSETENMFNASAFSKMKTTAYLVNTARGKIVDEQALLAALESGRISGYATDVLADETHFNEQFSSHPLVEYAKTHQKVIIVPHIGGMTHESRAASDVFIANKIVNWFDHKHQQSE